MRHYAIVGLAALLTGTSAFAQTTVGPQDTGQAKPTKDLRGPASAAASGQDPCLEWELKGDDLTACRGQWATARTNAEQLAVRQTYGNKVKGNLNGPLREGPATKGRAANAGNPCDSLHLKAPDLSECRAQWQSGQTEEDRQQILTRYREVASGNSSPTHSRKPAR